MFSRQDFIEFILDHYENPRNYGSLPNATIAMKGGNPNCGDIVTLYLCIDSETQTIEEITFTGEGCTISQAATSILTTQIKGQSLDVVRKRNSSELLEELGPSVMRSRRRCATLPLHTLQAALSEYLQQHRALTAEDKKDIAFIKFEKQADSERE